MKTKHLFILAFIIGITVTSCKKDDESKTQDNIQGTWTYKRTEDAGNGTPSVTNVSTGGENIVFKSDLTFVITSNYLMAQLANGLGSTPLNNGTYAISNDGSTVTLSGKGQTSPSTPGGSQIIDNAWNNTLVISEINSNKLSFTQAYNYQWLTFYFEK
jgi:hypothetical protein